MQKKTLATITTLLIFSIAATTISPSNSALFPGTTIPTWAYLQVVPDTVGIGQNVLLVMWIDKPPPTANGVFR